MLESPVIKVFDEKNVNILKLSFVKIKLFFIKFRFFWWNLIKGPIYNDQPPQTPGPIYGNPPSYGGPTTPNAAYSPGDRYSQPFRQPTSQSMNGPGSNVAIKKMNPPETPGSALDFQAPTERVLLFWILIRPPLVLNAKTSLSLFM